MESRWYATTKGATEGELAILTCENFYLYCAALAYSGIHPFPNKKMYWGTGFGEGCEIIGRLFRRDDFRVFEKYIHLAGMEVSNQEKKEDRFWKLKPLFSLLNKSGGYFPKCGHYSVDESMIRFYGHHQDKVQT